MLTREITYINLDGKKVTEKHYFHLSKTDVATMQFGEGYSDKLRAIFERDDTQALFAEFKKMILASYGVKSDDGNSFIKDEAVTHRFTQSLAYDQMFYELLTSVDLAAAFFNGIFPQEIIEAAKQQQLDQDKPVGPPPTPSTALVPPAMPTT